MIRMNKNNFMELVTNLAKTECCTGDMQCSKETTTNNEDKDCIICWTKRLKKYIECYAK